MKWWNDSRFWLQRSVSEGIAWGWRVRCICINNWRRLQQMKNVWAWRMEMYRANNSVIKNPKGGKMWKRDVVDCREMELRHKSWEASRRRYSMSIFGSQNLCSIEQLATVMVHVPGNEYWQIVLKMTIRHCSMILGHRNRVQKWRVWGFYHTGKCCDAVSNVHLFIPGFI